MVRSKISGVNSGGSITWRPQPGAKRGQLGSLKHLYELSDYAELTFRDVAQDD